MNNKSQLFSNTNRYKVELEKKYLVRQNIFVLSLISLIGILSIIYLFLIKEDMHMIVGLGSGFAVIIMFNIACLSYGETQIEFLKFNKFITSIGFFTLMTTFLLYFESPSMIPFLFLAYLIAAVYKDIKVLLIMSLYFILTVMMLLINYGYLFDFQFNPMTNNFVIALFVILFLSLLMISTYITIKESQFFYNQISFSKEKECRNLELLINLKSQIETDCHFYPEYYDLVKDLFKEFTSKLKSNNVFEDKIDIVRMLAEGESKESILNSYPDFTVLDIHRLESLVIQEDTLLRKIAMHVFYYNQRDIHEKEIFSETHFESFNKSVDEMDIKIVAFSILFVILKRGLPGTKPLSKDALYHILIETDFYYALDPKIRLIYQEYPEVFEAIIQDIYDEVIS